VNRYITVTLDSDTATREDDGDTTHAPTSATYDQVRFAPRSSVERQNARTPAVITAASLYRRGEFPVKAQDTIRIVGQDPLVDGSWQVVGDVGRWASGVEVAVQRVGSAG
jgi:hypothetical protein